MSSGSRLLQASAFFTMRRAMSSHMFMWITALVSFFTRALPLQCILLTTSSCSVWDPTSCTPKSAQWIPNHPCWTRGLRARFASQPQLMSTKPLLAKIVCGTAFQHGQASSCVWLLIVSSLMNPIPSREHRSNISSYLVYCVLALLVLAVPW